MARFYSSHEVYPTTHLWCPGCGQVLLNVDAEPRGKYVKCTNRRCHYFNQVYARPPISLKWHGEAK